jgi:hypothetical protein
LSDRRHGYSRAHGDGRQSSGSRSPDILGSACFGLFVRTAGGLLKARIAVALRDELGRVPTAKEIEQVFLLTRAMYKAVLGLHYRREEQRKAGQLALF